MATKGGGARQGRDSGASEGIGGSRRGERSQRECERGQGVRRAGHSGAVAVASAMAAAGMTDAV